MRLNGIVLGLGAALLCGFSAVPSPTLQPMTSQNATSIDELLRAVRTFSEAWFLKNDLHHAGSYLSSEFPRSPYAHELLRAKGMSDRPELAQKLFIEHLAFVRKSAEERMGLPGARSLSSVIEPAQIPNPEKMESLKLSAPESEWYTIFKLVSPPRSGVQTADAESAWIISKLANNEELYVLAFKVKAVPEGVIEPIALIWRREGHCWRIIALTGIPI